LSGQNPDRKRVFQADRNTATIVGDAAVVGDSLTLTWAADVRHLKLTVQGKSIVATWDWPEGAYDAKVVVREDAYPTGPDDPQARSDRCFHPGYMVKHRFVISIKGNASRIYVTVYAIYHEHGTEYASGCTAGARDVVDVVPSIRLHYSVKKFSWLAQFFLKIEPC
jgi:hypothetical protein